MDIQYQEKLESCKGGLRVLQPWQDNPWRLHSWLEMLQFSATRFVWIGAGLRGLREDALLTSIVLPGDEPLFNMAAELDDRAIAKAVKWLEFIEAELREIGLGISAATAAELLKDLKNTEQRKPNCQWLSDQTKGLEKLLRKELIQRDFFYVPPERSKYFPRKNEPHAFSDAVATAFPSASFDIHEAAMCMALGRSTAAVMHVIRALEPSLRAMAKDAGIFLKRDNWQEAVDAVEKALTPTGVPDRDRREFLAAAAVQFRFFKDAWRNQAMHAREKYTEDEAVTIYAAARSFMVQLAKRLKE